MDQGSTENLICFSIFMGTKYFRIYGHNFTCKVLNACSYQTVLPLSSSSSLSITSESLSDDALYLCFNIPLLFQCLILNGETECSSHPVRSSSCCWEIDCCGSYSQKSPVLVPPLWTGKPQVLKPDRFKLLVYNGKKEWEPISATK